MECLGLHSTPKAEVRPGHLLTDPTEEEREGGGGGGGEEEEEEEEDGGGGYINAVADSVMLYHMIFMTFLKLTINYMWPQREHTPPPPPNEKFWVRTCFDALKLARHSRRIILRCSASVSHAHQPVFHSLLQLKKIFFFTNSDIC
jgi:hypothetical protein